MKSHAFESRALSPFPFRAPSFGRGADGPDSEEKARPDARSDGRRGLSALRLWPAAFGRKAERPQDLLSKEHPGPGSGPIARPAEGSGALAAEPAPAGSPPALGAGALLTTAAWLGALTGLAELGLLLAWHQLRATSVLGTLQMNRHFLWMVPATHLTIFVALGLPLALPARWLPAWYGRGVAWLLTALAFGSLLLMVPGLHPFAVSVLALGLARPASRRIATRGPRSGRVVRRGLAAMLGAIAILGGVTYDRVVLRERRALAALPPASPGAPNVLLVVLDTVAADHMSLHGYRRDTTPNLARLARRGVVFDGARAAAPWTLPSHASLFTGRWPHELGKVQSGRPLDATYPTLAEFLARRGYATAGFVGNTYYCNSWYGLARGFAHYEDYFERSVLVSPEEALRCTALGRTLIRLAGTAYNVRPDTANYPKDVDRINRDLLGWLDAHPRRPFFAFLNYMEAHDPYLVPPGFDRHFGLRPESVADIELIRNWYNRGRANSPARDRALVLDAYDDCLAALDEGLGRLFDELGRRGILDETLVVVTADHGEQFAEHGEYGHGRSLYRPEVGVPLLIFGPRGIPAGLRVGAPVSLRDVAATVAERVGPPGTAPFPGRSLARFWDPAVPSGPEGPVLSEVNSQSRPSKTPHPKLASVVVDDTVYIRGSDGREELYSLADRAESTNLIDSVAAPVLSRCRATLDALVGPVVAPPR